VQPKGLGKLKKKFTSSALEPATFRFVAQCLTLYVEGNGQADTGTVLLRIVVKLLRIIIINSWDILEANRPVAYVSSVQQ
jgi:hypothetical protein